MAALPDPGASTRAHARRSAWTGLDQASVMSMELLSAILVWTGVGWLGDRWLGTAPWLLVLGALVGNGAGLYLIWLRSERLNAIEAARRSSRAGSAEEAAGGR